MSGQDAQRGHGNAVAPRTSAARATGPALEAAYQFALWLAPTVEKFPRTQKFTLGDRILAAAYDVIELLIEATYARRRRDLLARANLGLQKLRIFCRMALDLKHLDPRRFEHAVREIDGIGRLVGGWMKASPEGVDGTSRPLAS